MSTVQIFQDGALLTVDASDPRAPQIAAPSPPSTVYDPAVLIETLFTPAERVGFMAQPQGALFATLIAASQSVDIASPTFRAYLAQAVQGGFLTQARADQVLAGTPAPQGA